MLQGYLFMYPACLQEPSKTHLQPILYLSWKSDFPYYFSRILSALEMPMELGDGIVETGPQEVPMPMENGRSSMQMQGTSDPNINVPERVPGSVSGP